MTSFTRPRSRNGSTLFAEKILFTAIPGKTARGIPAAAPAKAMPVYCAIRAVAPTVPMLDGNL